MQLSEFHVERYRNFLESSHVPLRPLTLLFGYNSAGKSALLRLLPLLAESGRPREVGLTEPLALDSEPARGASYRDLRCRYTERNEMTLGATWGGADGNSTRLSWSFKEDPRRGKPGPVRYRMASVSLGAVSLQENLDGSDRWETVDEQPRPFPLSFSGLRARLDTAGELPPEVRAALDDANRRLTALAGGVCWLGAVRAPIERRPQFRARPPSMGSTGAEASSILAHDQVEGGPLRAAVNHALVEMFDQKLEVDVGDDDYELRLARPAREDVNVSIVDVGEGVPQVLPILTLGAMAREGRLGDDAILVLEQPEMHLHPKAERALARFLVHDVVLSPRRPRCLIESHSENLLLFIQLAVVRGQLSPEDVALCWIEAAADGPATVRTITLDRYGKPDYWPPGVFSEDVAMARELLLARRGA